VTNVDYPGPLVAGNTETHPRLANIVIGAMSKCVPERAMAAESSTSTNFVFGGEHPDHDEYFACYDIMSGGWGGRLGHDGNDCVTAINGNCRSNPTEVFETRFPLRVDTCELIPDSGGAGQWRGGLGFRRVLTMVSVPITGSQCTDRHEIRPYPLLGGQPGGNGTTQIMKAGETEWKTVRDLYGKVSTSKYANVTFEPGDKVMLATPGGGGYGNPKDRDRSSVLEDVAEGFVSKDAAKKFYSVSV
jgi:5-oxoprolinase (ATP-hydrolysing)/N-methylhydantoinase B